MLFSLSSSISLVLLQLVTVAHLWCSVLYFLPIHVALFYGFKSISWDLLTATCELLFDISLMLPSSVIWIICTRSNGTESLWRLQLRSPSRTFLFRNSCFQRMWTALAIICCYYTPQTQLGLPRCLVLKELYARPLLHTGQEHALIVVTSILYYGQLCIFL